MYNWNSHKKKRKELKKLEKQKEEYLKGSLARQEERTKMAFNYKKRVENFVLQMMDHPVITHDATPELYKFREEDPSKNLGGGAVIIRSFKNERDRINEAVTQHKYYESDYTQSPTDFRPRDRKKDIQPEMHFRSNHALDHLAQRIERVVRRSKNDIHIDRNDPLIVELSKSPVQVTNRYIAKQMLPELHMKTHFKAAASLYLALPDSLVDSHMRSKTSRKTLTKDEQRKAADDGEAPAEEVPIKKTQGGGSNPRLPIAKRKTIDIQLEEDAQQIQANQKLMPGANEKNYQWDGLNPVDVSKKILLKCNVIRNKNDNIHMMNKGAGHLTSWPDKTTGEVYENLYHKSIR